LLSYPLDPDQARGHLATSVYLQMAIQPHIVHIVGHTEAHHAATAEDIIEAAGIIRRAIDNALGGQPDMTSDPAIQQRKEELVTEARLVLEAFRELAQPSVADPLTDASTLTRAVTTGILDAPQLVNNPYGLGQAATRIDQRGACVAVHPKTAQRISESDRIDMLFHRAGIR
jgi:hypothetical protein